MGDFRVPPPDQCASVAGGDEGGAGVDADGRWTAVEEATEQVLRAIRPTVDSERQRAMVISFVQRLLNCSLGCQVFPYGSVPLKTYLPDGDIDLTVLSYPDAVDALISDIFDVLKNEELNEDAEYEVKDVQLISAEVKIVKCLVHNFIVDISCNQLGGLCTLCFLGQIDRVVDKDHLFKRSIILIKAWCYYESRILGATHGLISTYALEVLVLYIFHVYHASLKGPSSVLYRFLDYFSKFDWENYCVSLHGPVSKPSLPDVGGQTFETATDGLLFSKQFLTNSTSMFTVPSREFGEQPRPFQQKFINIIDPLKDNNNLGRSVSKGNFYRIRSALKYGADKLGQILSLPTETSRKELKSFFASTLARHGWRHQDSSQPLDPNYSGSFHSSDTDSSLGVRSPSEGTSDSSSQASDASSSQGDRSLQAGHNFATPSEPTIYRELDGVRIHRVPMANPNCSASGHQSWNSVDYSETSESLETLCDLTSDYESHLQSLLYGQSFHGNAVYMPMSYNLPIWDVSYQPPQFGQDPYLHLMLNADGAIWGQPMRQVRGTGTYIPRTDLGSWRGGKPTARRGRNQTPHWRSPRWPIKHHGHSYGPVMAPVQAHWGEQMYHQTQQSPFYPFLPYATNGLSEYSEKHMFCSAEPPPEDNGQRDENAAEESQESEPMVKPPAVLIPEQQLADAKDEMDRRALEQPYKLKDEADFPPLTPQMAISRSVFV